MLTYLALFLILKIQFTVWPCLLFIFKTTNFHFRFLTNNGRNNRWKTIRGRAWQSKYDVMAILPTGYGISSGAYVLKAIYGIDSSECLILIPFDSIVMDQINSMIKQLTVLLIFYLFNSSFIYFVVYVYIITGSWREYRKMFRNEPYKSFSTTICLHFFHKVHLCRCSLCFPGFFKITLFQNYD